MTRANIFAVELFAGAGGLGFGFPPVDLFAGARGFDLGFSVAKTVSPTDKRVQLDSTNQNMITESAEELTNSDPQDAKTTCQISENESLAGHHVVNNTELQCDDIIAVLQRAGYWPSIPTVQSINVEIAIFDILNRHAI